MRSWMPVAGVGLVLIAAGVGIAAWQFAPRPTGAPIRGDRPPNVLFVVWDTVRADRLSLYGHDRPTTPFLERLAPRAAVYERAISPSYWTLPSHASLFTGLPVSVHGADASYKWLDGRFTTIAEHFEANGYDTYAWSSNPNINRTANTVQGFRTFHQPFGRNQWREKTEAYTGSLVHPEDETTRPNPERFRSLGYLKGGAVTEEAFTGWLDDGREPGKPFFAFLNYMEAHTYRLPTEASRAAIMTDPAAYHRALKTSNLLNRQTNVMYGRWKAYNRKERQALYDLYDASIRDLDGLLEHLLGSLDQRGLLDDTIVVLTADHGEQLGEHGLYLHNFSVYEPLVHVPLVISGPGVEPARIRTPVTTAALFSTLVGLTGLPAPDAPIVTDDLLHPTEGPVVTELTEPCAHPENRRLDFSIRDWAATYTAIYDGATKYIEASNGRHELYDLDRDPRETRNLLDGPRGGDDAARLGKALARWTAARPVVAATEEDRRRDAADRAAQRDDDLMDQLEELGYVDEQVDAPDPAADRATPDDGGG